MVDSGGDLRGSDKVEQQQETTWLLSAAGDFSNTVTYGNPEIAVGDRPSDPMDLFLRFAAPSNATGQSEHCDCCIVRSCCRPQLPTWQPPSSSATPTPSCDEPGSVLCRRSSATSPTSTLAPSGTSITARRRSRRPSLRFSARRDGPRPCLTKISTRLRRRRLVRLPSTPVTLNTRRRIVTTGTLIGT